MKRYLSFERSDSFLWICASVYPEHISLRWTRQYVTNNGFCSPVDLRQVLPKCQDLHRAVADLAVVYQADLGTVLPPVNSTLLLFRYIRYLGLPRKSLCFKERFALLI